MLSVPAESSQEPNPVSSGLDIDNLSPEQAQDIPDEGHATIHYKVHHRRSEEHIRNGEKKERHHVRMHVTHFEPHHRAETKEGAQEKPGEEKPKRKRLLASTDAQDAVRQYLAPVSPNT
jgi:hypothetical protein